MTTDLTGGRAPESDLVIADPPENPLRLEGSSMWIWDDAGRIGLPRLGVDARGETWTTQRMLQANIALPDGRVFALRGNGEPHDTRGDDGLPRVIGGGPIRMTCIEPYRHWTLSFDGTAVATTSDAQRRGQAPDPTRAAKVRIDIDARMVRAAWGQGTLEPKGRFVEGEDRFEQLFEAHGTVTIDGDEIPVDGGGLRIHRTGGSRSDMSTWRGHCWQSAFFPSGRSFGYIEYADYPDGSVRYGEGFVDIDGERLPAQVAVAPWMTELAVSGQQVPVTLETKRGRITIDGTSAMSTFGIGGPLAHLQQGIVRYRWDGEEAYGMIERSYPESTLAD